MTCATITTHASNTAQPVPGHGQHSGPDRPRTVHQPSAPRLSVIGCRTSAATIDPAVAHAVYLHRIRPLQPAFYAASECERLPAHLREGV